jgi:hypothetical protein
VAKCRCLSNSKLLHLATTAIAMACIEGDRKKHKKQYNDEHHRFWTKSGQNAGIFFGTSQNRRALMSAVEAVAREAERSLLVLDTREGDPAETLYLALGYIKYGTVPQYARSADGSLDDCVFFYRIL